MNDPTQMWPDHRDEERAAMTEHNEPGNDALKHVRQRNRITRVSLSALRTAKAEDPDLDVNSPQVHLVCDDLEKLLAAITAETGEGEPEDGEE